MHLYMHLCQVLNCKPIMVMTRQFQTSENSAPFLWWQEVMLALGVFLQILDYAG